MRFCPGDPFPAGTMPPDPPGAYANGVYLLTTPLTAGVHHLSFMAEANVSGSVFSQDVTYTITAAPH